MTNEIKEIGCMDWVLQLQQHFYLEKKKDDLVRADEEVLINIKGVDHTNAAYHFASKKSGKLEDTKIKRIKYRITKDTDIYTECIGYHSIELEPGKSALDDIITVFGTPSGGNILVNTINLTYNYPEARINVFYNTDEQEGTLEITFN